MRVVDAENSHAEIAKRVHVQLPPRASQVRVVKIQRINVLVFLRRVLSVFNGPIMAA